MKKIILGHFNFTLCFLVAFAGLVSSCFLLSYTYFLSIDTFGWQLYGLILSFLGAIVVGGGFIIQLFFFIKNKEDLTESNLKSGKKRIKIAVLFFLIITIGSAVFSAVSIYNEEQYKKDLKEEYLGINKEDLWSEMKEKSETKTKYGSSVSAYDYPRKLEQSRTKSFSGRRDTLKVNDIEMNEVFLLAKIWKWEYQKINDKITKYIFVFNEEGEVIEIEIDRLFRGT